jgi:hypothetical protein
MHEGGGWQARAFGGRDRAGEHEVDDQHVGRLRVERVEQFRGERARRAGPGKLRGERQRCGASEEHARAPRSVGCPGKRDEGAPFGTNHAGERRGGDHANPVAAGDELAGDAQGWRDVPAPVPRHEQKGMTLECDQAARGARVTARRCSR